MPNTSPEHNSQPASHIFLGLDIGAINVRAAVVDRAGRVLRADSERIVNGPSRAIAALVERLQANFDLTQLQGAGVTGSGRHIYDGMMGWQLYSSPFAAIAGVLNDHPDARTIIAIGGQSSLVIGLEGGLDKPWRVARSPLCAAGTGRFLEQQSSRLGITIEEFGSTALEWTEAPPRIAARCSVFAKSDLIHLQQKGWPVSAMLAGLSDSVARMVQAQWRDPFVAPVYCIGGVAANQGVVRALRSMAGVEPVLVPENHASREALGAALLARDAKTQPEELLPRSEGDTEAYYLARALAPVASSNGWHPYEFGEGVADVYLGVDVGSTSTKAAVIDAHGKVLAKTYLMTAGQPLEAIKQVMANLVPMVEGKVNVKAVGVTGSGRYLVGNFIGADLIKNEITAQTRAALNIDPQVNTVFELGGQDSKFVYLENGTVLDYQMNKACAAGTGSFIDELAEQLGISTRTGEFARLAFEADTQLDLGEKCTAFMSQAVTSAQHAGASLGTIVSSLSTSLAKNYLSKVVSGRRVGNRIFLTGAVFYNDAAVAAFQAEMPGKTFIVPEHKEVTGAIGAALLAKEAIPADAVPTHESTFRGFSAVANASYKLSNFNCYKCENSCAISVMTNEKGEKLYYGSRCDLYDAGGSNGSSAKVSTPFTERETLLFADYDPAKGSGKVVGVPRALMTYDLAPTITGFLNALGVKILYSSPTNKRLIEKAMQYAYTDSCYPMKLLHGHIAELLEKSVDYVLVPNAIRMGPKTSDADQRYSCPLVQASPYITRAVFNLGDHMLDPIIDFVRGDDLVINSFADVAVRLGFSRSQGLEAAKVGLAKQRDFDVRLREYGERVLAEIAADPNRIGVVLLSRAYNAQDAGANLGMSQELGRLGVIPIPMDCLPLERIDILEISDRPYWNYERKILAASRLIADHHQLFGLFLSNFGCGPNSIIQNIVEDMMGGKPLGQIEVDEHAAEAGYITRLEALVDTLRGYRKAGLKMAGDPASYTRRVPARVRSGEHVLIARMTDHAEVVAAAMRSYGVNAQMLPDSDERSMALSRDVTSGKECLPFRDSLGVFMRMAEEGNLPQGTRALMAGSYGPCRLGKYAQEQQKILRDGGIDIEIMTSVSNKAYTDIGLGPKFLMLTWQGAIAADMLQKMLWMTRPYEKLPGVADAIFDNYLDRIVQAIEAQRPLQGLMREAVGAFKEAKDSTIPRKPLIGINGEIYLRANRFCNKDVVLVCEANGLEVEVAPMSEWIKYTIYRNLEDAWGNRELKRLSKGLLTKWASQYYESQISSWVKSIVHEVEPSTEELLRTSSEYLPSRNGSEAVLSLGGGLRQMRDARFAGVISVMPHGCMPGGIVAAIGEQISRQYGRKPWISLTYDGFPDKVNPERIADLAEQVRHNRQ